MISELEHPTFTVDSRDQATVVALRKGSKNVVETKPFEIDVTLLTGIVVGLTAALNVVTAAINNRTAAVNKARSEQTSIVRLNGVNYKITPDNHEKIIRELQKIYEQRDEV